MPTTTEAPRVDVLGVHISGVTLSGAVDEIAGWIAEGERRYVCVTGVHGVMESQRDEALRAVHNDSGLTVPDGMPLVWCARAAGRADVTRVYGPDLMLALCERGLGQGWRHFFYGGAAGVADELAAALQQRFPGLVVAGTHTPPFRPLTAEESAAVVDMVNDARADIVWVGLSTPKQERWMAEHRHRLHASALIGVGAAFDFHSGRVRQAPAVLQRAGLEWAFRLAMDPRRLWRRYLRNNPAFLARLARRRPRLVPGAARDPVTPDRAAERSAPRVA
jgi:N-acetylglucosaminyldiphosphoundecaprenol N-acetyl-beta-D-mannosaminyltransferase